MNKTIGQRIKEVRTENKLSQGDFGLAIGVSQDTVSLWETGKSLPTVDYVIIICKTYNLSSDYLLCLSDF